MGARGIVVASIVAVASVLLAPVFVEATGSLDFSMIEYGDQTQLVLEQMPLLAALAAIVVVGSFIAEQ